MVRIISLCLLTALLVCGSPAQQSQRTLSTGPTENLSVALGLIRDQKYDDAINRLDDILERRPNNAEALTLKATAEMYRERDFVKAQRRFEEAAAKGGGATFLVNHSHEITKMSVEVLADFCTGWLHFRKDGITFEPLTDGHPLKIAYAEVAEVKQNANRRLFHIKLDKANYNFMPRSRSELEALLAIVMYRKLSGTK